MNFILLFCIDSWHCSVFFSPQDSGTKCFERVHTGLAGCPARWLVGLWWVLGSVSLSDTALNTDRNYNAKFSHSFHGEHLKDGRCWSPYMREAGFCWMVITCSPSWWAVDVDGLRQELPTSMSTKALPRPIWSVWVTLFFPFILFPWMRLVHNSSSGCDKLNPQCSAERNSGLIQSVVQFHFYIRHRKLRVTNIMTSTRVLWLAAEREISSIDCFK